MSVPQDPFILLSWVNTQLRDGYAGLSELCAAEGLDEEDLTARLAALNYHYDPEANRFC